MSDKIVITNAELQQIESSAVRAPSKDGSIAGRVVDALIKLMSDTYGIDLGIETEDKANERAKREAKLTNARGGSRKSIRKQPNDSFDDF